ncbi:hypothetical protein ACFO1B_44015 [Dactylosporangium siamense]|uniref:Uncharacterized protein n=1 Tax=Dactylosporangium siamense TaxID=685454 RepID=A0A919PZF6_9ACTN|nr:hypothetical protein [Dactylosporangium siamense]GIG52904.1 hypothetical protein Dsi01nite_109450 [Dactylosporangium siamense]
MDENPNTDRRAIIERPGEPHDTTPHTRHAPTIYTAMILARIAEDEHHGPLRGAQITCYADLHDHVDANDYTVSVGIPEPNSDLINAVETGVDTVLRIRAYGRDALDQTIRIMQSLPDTCTKEYRAAWDTAVDLATALVRLATNVPDPAPIVNAIIESYIDDPRPTTTVAERITTALNTAAS